MRVSSMTSPRTGREVANQFLIEDGSRIVFQSYNSMIAEIDYSTNTIKIGADWDYSRTTSKYRNAFFEEYIPTLASADAIRKALKVGQTENGYYKVIRA